MTRTETSTRAVSRRVSAATNATYVAFIGSGFAFASWASRIPQVRDRLQLSSADLGLVLLAIAVGSLIALPLAGLIVARLGSRKTVAFMAVLLSVGLAGAAAGYLAGIVPLLIGLFLLGFANGAWDVAMNVQGALVERELGRAIMPRFHAGFSIGTVAGALIGAAMVGLDIPVTVHLIVVAVAVVVVVPLAVRRFLPDLPEPLEDGAPAPAGTPGILTRWREPRTLLVGVVVLAFAFAEGAGNDWISVSLIDGYQASAVLGTLGFAVFLTAMTIGRWFGPGLLDRYGRVVVVRGLAVVAVVGLVLFIFSPWVGLAFAGALLWGLGASLGFPVGMSAAADDPSAAGPRVSVVASIGYCAFLAGPPLIGFLGESITVLKALISVAVLLGVATLVATSLRPLPPAGSELTPAGSEAVRDEV
jgi:MFS family permease